MPPSFVVLPGYLFPFLVLQARRFYSCVTSIHQERLTEYVERYLADIWVVPQSQVLCSNVFSPLGNQGVSTVSVFCIQGCKFATSGAHPPSDNA